MLQNVEKREKREWKNRIGHASLVGPVWVSEARRVRAGYWGSAHCGCHQVEVHVLFGFLLLNQLWGGWFAVSKADVQRRERNSLLPGGWHVARGGCEGGRGGVLRARGRGRCAAAGSLLGLAAPGLPGAGVCAGGWGQAAHTPGFRLLLVKSEVKSCQITPARAPRR